jgi:murein DD-endopeptidase MepM/ murein hydrolase activator NlpD
VVSTGSTTGFKAVAETEDAAVDMEEALASADVQTDAVLTDVTFVDDTIPNAGGGVEAEAQELEAFLRSPPLSYSSYKIVSGDMIGVLAEKWGLSQDSLISINGIKQTRYILPGQVLRVPNQDGIIYKAKAGDTASKIAEKYTVSADDIIRANELFGERVSPGSSIFVPGARMDMVALQEINGDLFIWPVPSRVITSSFGYRRDPFGATKSRTYHTGMDLRAPMGTRVNAAMAGRVATTAWSDVYGNYIVINHHSGYRTLYGHLSKIGVKAGQYVEAGQRIGYSGSTGYSTGPHLHFTVYKHGALVNPRLLMN